MGLKLEMLTSNEFVPVHDENYVAFVVSDFYGSLDFGYYLAEFQYEQVDSEDGYATGSSCCYNGQDDLPFGVPLRWDDTKKEFYVLSQQEIDFYKYHKDENEKYWYIKDWFLHNSNQQIHSEDLDRISLGVMLESDFITQVEEANKVREKVKYGEEVNS